MRKSHFTGTLVVNVPDDVNVFTPHEPASAVLPAFT
jgi:hypothetical protein